MDSNATTPLFSHTDGENDGKKILQSRVTNLSITSPVQTRITKKNIDRTYTPEMESFAGRGIVDNLKLKYATRRLSLIMLFVRLIYTTESFVAIIQVVAGLSDEVSKLMDLIHSTSE